MKLGSHNSMSYLKPQWWLRPFAWIGRCQCENIKEQLLFYKIRWFDLRLAFDKKGKPYFAHGLFSYKSENPCGVLYYLNSIAKLIHDKVYIRLLNERDSEFNKKCFQEFCEKVEKEFPDLIFTGGHNKKDWKCLYDFGNYPDMPLIDKYSSCNHDKCEYDENCNEVNHVNNTGVVIDDICPEWYAKRNNMKNRIKYLDEDVYLLQDFIGKY